MMKHEVLSSLGTAALFAVVGILAFGLAFLLMQKLTPFSIRKEIETDQNVALAIVVAAIILGLAHIIAHAVS
ncbi:MAG TPA: DUF350 domain-containing protein [Polyangiaceae bacterium]|nr:DUF350 domain-containing protein [Polyangiaceae bacterium]